MLAGRWRWIAAVGLAGGCTPTVELGSNVGSTGVGVGAGSSGTSGDSTGVMGSSGSTGGSSDTMAVGGGTSTGAGSGTDTGTGTGTGTETETETETDGVSQSCRDAFPPGFPCLTCAELECCDEIDLCLGQPECDCFYLCVTAGTPPPLCEAMCDPSSGAAAVSTCLSQACTFDCGA